MLSNSSKYAINAVIYLALHASPTKRLAPKDIAEALHIPTSFLAKILQTLARKKVISSNKGPGAAFGSPMRKKKPLDECGKANRRSRRSSLLVQWVSKNARPKNPVRCTPQYSLLETILCANSPIIPSPLSLKKSSIKPHSYPPQSNCANQHYTLPKAKIKKLKKNYILWRTENSLTF